MKYQSVNELEHFDFSESVLQNCERVGESVKITLDNVKIRPEHSLNRDIGMKRTNDFVLTFQNVQAWDLVEEGYTLFDADMNPYKKVEDRQVAQDDIAYDMGLMEECYVDEVVDENSTCRITWVVEDHTWHLDVTYENCVQEWDRWLTYEQM